jgi:transposase InsO family protein
MAKMPTYRSAGMYSGQSQAVGIGVSRYAEAFPRAAVAYSEALGVTSNEVMTDNPGSYRGTNCAQTCSKSVPRDLFATPYTPRADGKAERLIRSALPELVYAPHIASCINASQSLPRWLHSYSWRPPHVSLARQAPMYRLGFSRKSLSRLHT